MNKEISIKKNNAVYLSLALVVSISAVAIPMQIALAQTQTQQLLLRLIGTGNQAGLVNVSVNGVQVLNNVNILNGANIPITVQVPVNVAAPITVCAVAVNVLGQSGSQNCRTVNDIQLQNQPVITIPVPPAPSAPTAG
jgi:hypothetical protein